MRAAVGCVIAVCLLVVVVGHAAAKGPRPGHRAPAAQNGFSEVELNSGARSARPQHVVVVQLEHPSAVPGVTNPGGIPGRHRIPYAFPDTRRYRFCMRDDNGQAHRMVLEDAAGRQALSVTAGGDCVTTTIPAGGYTLTLIHDASGDATDVNTVFIQPKYEPVDASVLRALAGGGGPLPRAAIDSIESSDTATCLATSPDLFGNPIPSTTLCCQYVDTWALQASNGLYVSTDSVSTNVPFGLFSGYLTTFSPSGGPITSAGPQERFEVYSCVGSGLQDQPTDPPLIALKANNGNFLTGIPPTADLIDIVVPIVSQGIFPSPDPQWAYFFNLVYYNNGQITLQPMVSGLFGLGQWLAHQSVPLPFAPGTYVSNLVEVGDLLSVFEQSPKDDAYFTPTQDKTILIVTGNCKQCRMDGVNLSSYNLAGVDLSGASLQNAVLSNAYMPDANLSRADLTGAHLDKVDFYQVSGAPTLAAATLYTAQFSEANLIDLVLDGAKLEGADFTSAQMLGASLKGITHVSGSLNGRVSFVNALLAGATFANSTFDGGDFTNAIFSTTTNSVNLTVRNSPTTSVSQPYTFTPTIRPLSTTANTVCPDGSSGPCTTDAQWVAQNPPVYEGYNDPNQW